MIVSCPKCRQEYDIKDSRAGQTIQCSMCCEEFIVPSDNEPENNDLGFIPQISLDERKTIHKSTQPTHKRCPMCGEKILYIAKKCRYCQTELKGNKVIKHVDRTTYVLLGLLAGGIGAHSFYAGKKEEGNRHLMLFAFSFITFGITGLISSIYALFEVINDPTEQKFKDKNHNNNTSLLHVFLFLIPIIIMLLLFVHIATIFI